MADEVEHPVAGVDYPGTYPELLDWFPDNPACVEYLEQLRWSDGFTCPACGAEAFWRTGKGLRMCVACGRQTSVTAGTIFHRTRTPLATWFAAIWFVTSQKNGVSAQGLQRVLGFGSYETAWAWMHKLRRAMVRPDRDRLRGTVELDEVMIGGHDSGSAGLGGDKVPVMIAVERGEGKRLGRMRAEIATVPASRELVSFAASVVEPGSTIHTDGLRTLRRLGEMGYTHHYTNTYSAADPSAVLPGVHRISSLLKRWLAGTLHHRVGNEHLRYYLDEYTFRFNRRTARRRGLLFYRLLQQAVATDPHPLHDLLRPGDPGW